jgi:uncharacterized protein
MTDMVEVVIDSIRVSLMSQQRIVILRELRDERYLAIWIGIYEAEAITLALQDVEVARPLTWDLLKNTLKALNGRVLRVEVVALREDTFYGNIVIEADGRVLNIDSRPSDALALAVRTHAPIFVTRSVMQAAGITPDDDLQDKPLAPRPVEPLPAEPAPDEEGSENRLSIFEDFLDKLDKGDKPDIDPEDEEPKS